MGYNLGIGELVSSPNIDDANGPPWLDVAHVDGEEIGAPLNNSGHYDNEIWPAYSVWHEFCDLHGLTDVFYGVNENRHSWWDEHGQHVPIFARHPGVVPLTQVYLDQFRRAEAEALTSGAIENDLLRLRWLVWWTEWALANCKDPVFANS